jgi:hypothetical protein
LFYENEEVRAVVEGLNELKCSVCTGQKSRVFDTMPNLKKHLKENH